MQLGLSPSDCIVFEDAPKGVEAALNAGMKCIVITLLHEEHEFHRYPNVIKYVKDFVNLTPKEFGASAIINNQ